MAVPLKTENLSVRHAMQSGNAQRQWTTFRQPESTVFKHVGLRQSVD